MGIIKNKTVYRNKPFLKFEKMPHYSTGGQNGHILNSVILNLGFTKLVSRIRIGKLDPEKVEIINTVTGGILSTHQVDAPKGEPKEDYILRHSFLSKDNQYIGNAQKGWWYVKNNLRVHKEKPNQIAILVDDINLPEPMQEILGYYGYSHRGGQTFKIGDRLFDEKYKPKQEDYPEWQWAKWQKEYDDALIKYKNDEWETNDIVNDGISRYIPFRFRGKKNIENWDEAIQSALNMSNYLS